MAIIDKRGALADVAGRTLELGCGNRKRIPESIGVDQLDYECVDVVGDMFEVLAAIPTGSVGKVVSFHVFEHIENVESLLNEIARVIRAGGLLEFTVPHFSNPYYYSDQTHRSTWGLYSLSYYSASSPFTRRVPTYQRRFYFDIQSVNLVFKSTRPFWFRHAWKKGLQRLFNMSRYMSEFYEENLCWLLPCYEITYRLVRNASQVEGHANGTK